MTAHLRPSAPRRSLLALFGGSVLSLSILPLRKARGQATGSDDIVQPERAGPDAFMERAFALRERAARAGDQAYGAVVVKDGRIVGEAPSRVVTAGDPTAHAEMEAIRDAARRLGSRHLGGCTLYSSTRACPMCEAAAYWAGVEGLVHGRDRADGGRPRLCG